MKTTVTMEEVFLHPGEFVIGDEHCRMTTLLGSCVAITLWHPARRIGAMSHFLLPSKNGKSRGGKARDGRYGDEVMQLMLAELARLHVPVAECEAKIFGGGSMFPKNGQADLFGVGQLNGLMARELLHAHGIPIASESLFGVGHRKIIFDVSTGDVWARQEKLPDPYVQSERKHG